MSLIDNYAPQTFDDLLGQPTAQKLFKKWSLNHEDFPKVTFLVGESGRGKTTSIKLLAAMATCKTPIEKDGQKVPCGECAYCKNVFEEKWSPMKHVHFFSGRKANVDLIEKVEEKMKVTPIGVKSRVIIFDELQDASAGFIKALLSLLEKKNSRTKFIISTMEPKSLKMKGSNPTALTDRGTVVKFNKIKSDVIIDRLIYLTDNVLDPTESCPDTFIIDVIARIASEARGSMRRAMQLLETCYNAEAWTSDLADTLFLGVSEQKVDAVLDAILNTKDTMYALMDELDSYEELYRLANAKVTNACKKKISGTLDAGDFYSNKCQEIYVHPNFNELRKAFRKVHTDMGSYWRNDVFDNIIYDFVEAVSSNNIAVKQVAPRQRRR